MRHDLTVHASGAAPERHAIAVPTSAGGSRADGLFLPGAAPGAVRLLPAAAGLIVEADATGVRVGAHAVPPGTRRLLRPGERAEILGSALVLEAPAARDGGTRVAAAALLRDAAAGGEVIAGPRLVVLTGPAAGERHRLGREETVGRGRAATLRLADPQISRVHARVRSGPEGATVEDLRSKNGTRVNGIAIERRPSPLHPGDELALGETVLTLEDPAPASPRLPGPGGGPAGRGARRVPASAAAAALLALSAVALALAGS